MPELDIQVIQNALFKLNSYKACTEPTNTEPENFHGTINIYLKNGFVFWRVKKKKKDTRGLEANNQKENHSRKKDS